MIELEKYILGSLMMEEVVSDVYESPVHPSMKSAHEKSGENCRENVYLMRISDDSSN